VQYSNLKPRVLDSSSRLPLELLNVSEEIPSEKGRIITSTMLENNFMGEELLRIQNCKRRISKLMYGKQGLMTFLHHIFGLLNEDQMKRVNYYFTLKDQVC